MFWCFSVFIPLLPPYDYYYYCSAPDDDDVVVGGEGGGCCCSFSTYKHANLINEKCYNTLKLSFFPSFLLLSNALLAYLPLLALHVVM